MKKLSQRESTRLVRVFMLALTWTLLMPNAVGQSKPPKKAEGEPCTLSVQCPSGFCVDGVCCESSCPGTCRACSAAKKGTGRDGTCEMFKRGADPDNECANGACSGTGSCVLDPGNPCTSNAECVLNECVDGFCCNERCDGTCVACSAAKKGGGTSGICGPIAANSDPDKECASGDCNGVGVCTELAANGSACVADSECTSKRCVRGICCNHACTQDCHSCEAPGSVGTCTRICTPPPCTGTVGLPDPPPAPGLAVGGYPRSVIAADFNGDGFVDLATSNTNNPGASSTISVLLATGYNTFAASVDYPVGAFAKWTLATDVDGDGYLDIVWSNPSVNGVSVLFNLGNGTFGAEVDFPVGATLMQLVAADVNDDGRVDFVSIAGTTNNPSNQLVVVVNDGNGAYTFADYFTGSAPRAIRTADVNGDGKTDIVTANVGRTISVLPNNGDGTFPNRIDYPITEVPKELVVEDFTGDGAPDVVVLTFYTLGSLQNNGNGTFAASVDWAADYHDEALRAVDMDLDGDVDLVVSSISPQAPRVSLLRNQNGSFGARADHLVGLPIDGLALVDVTGDGLRDVIVASADGNAVIIVPNEGNGEFDVNHTGHYGTEMAAPIAVDVNNDGYLDLVAVDRTAHPNAITAFINDGSGSFSESYTSNSSLHWVHFLGAGDFNGDGWQDIAAGNVSNVTILLNQSDNTFVEQNIAAGAQYITGLTTGDFNGDGYVDLAATEDTSGSGTNGWNALTIHMGNGDGTFGSPQYYGEFLPDANCHWRGHTLAKIDFENDGDLDLVVAHCGGGIVKLHQNQGNGTFTASTLYSTGAPTVVDIADFDGNGVLDLAFTTTTSPGGITIKYRNAPLVFGPQVTYNLGAIPIDFVPADLNNDGRIDIAASTLHKNTITALLNQGNGVFAAPVEYLAGWSPGMMTSGDWNGDGRDDLAYDTSGPVGVMISTCSP